jgi:hypothetical protein
MSEADDGVIRNIDTGQAFNWSDACVVKGPTIGYDESASTQSRIYVRDYLKALFALK